MTNSQLATFNSQLIPPGYKQTEVGVIPEEWEVRPLFGAVKVATGQVSPRQEPYKSMILVAPDHIEEGTGRLLAMETASAQGAISGKYLFKPGDVVYSKIRPYLRKAILADFEGLCSADMYPLTPAKDVSSAFVFSVLLGHHFSSFTATVSARSGIPKINREELAQYALALPPPREQRAIAGALSDADALIGALDQLIAKKRDLKQAAMQQLLTGQTRLPGFHGEWETKRLGDLVETSSGTTPARAMQDRYYKNGAIAWVKTMDLTNSELFETSERVTELALKETCLRVYPVGTVLVAMYGGFQQIGRTGLLRIPAAVNQAITAIQPKADTLVSEYLLGTLNYRVDYWKSVASSSRKDPNITSQDTRNFPISYPSPSEQTAIAEVLSDMDAEVAALEQRRDKTRALKQGMMQELLTGKTRLTVES